MQKSRCALTRRAATMNQPTANQPTLNSCNSSWPHITFATNDQHSSSSCKCTSGHYFAHHGVKHNDFCCFKGVTYVAFTLCYKQRSFYIDFISVQCHELHWTDKNQKCDIRPYGDVNEEISDLHYQHSHLTSLV